MKTSNETIKETTNQIESLGIKKAAIYHTFLS